MSIQQYATTAAGGRSDLYRSDPPAEVLDTEPDSACRREGRSKRQIIGARGFRDPVSCY